MRRAFRSLAALALLLGGCLEGTQLVPPEENCTEAPTRTVSIAAGTYQDTGAVEAPEDVDESGYELTISEDRRTVVETFRRDGKLYRLEYAAEPSGPGGGR